MAISVEQFVESLSITGLMTAAEFKAVREGVAARKPPPDVETLAKELVKAGKLTMFQANSIYKGKGKGLVCGEYVLLEKIGAGGMGQVFKARHKRMNRIVAVKLLAPPDRMVDKDKTIQRFHQEVQTAARLMHPNIVTAHDAGESSGMHYLVMEYVEGQDLSACLKPDKKLPLDQALHIVLQAARGLEYAHGQGIVHRDIKPSNLLMDKKGNVKILDMGLARVEDALTGADRAAGEGLTQDGEVMGTIDYMAPEQGRNTRDADARSDIYSLGCTLYRLASGCVAFEGQSMVDKIMAHYEKPIPSLGKHCEGVSRRLEHAFERMLAKKPEERFQSMTEVIAELEACRADVPEEEHAPLVIDEPPVESELESFLSRASGTGSALKNMPLPPAPQGSSKGAAAHTHRQTTTAQPAWSKNRRTWIFAGSGLVVLVTIGALVAVLTRGKSPPTPAETPAVAQAEPANAASPTSAPALVPAVETANPPQSTASRAPRPPPTASPTVPTPQVSEPAVAAPSSPVTVPPIPPEGIDLLKLVDLKRDVGEGKWNLDGSALVASVETTCRLQFPQAPPPEYDLHVEVETFRRSAVALGLVVGSSRAVFSMNQHPRDTALLQIGTDVKQNPTLVSGAVGFGPGQPMAIVCQVRSTSVFVTLNGQTVVDWKGDPQQLSVASNWVGPDKTKLFLYSAGGARFTRYELLPPGGTPRPRPSPQPSPTPVAVATLPAKPGVRVNLLRQVDLKRDVVDGDWQYDGSTLASPNISQRCRFQFRTAPPLEYELHTEVEVNSDGNVYIGLVVGSSRAAFALSATGVTGLDYIAGISVASVRNETRRESVAGFGPGKPMTIVCRVRPTSVAITLNGGAVVDWKGDPQQLSFPSSSAGPDPTKLFIYTSRGGRFMKYVLVPTGGQPLAVPATPAVAAALPKVQELVGELPKNPSAAQRTDAARRLHEQAAAADDDALRYALLTEAVKLATAADDVNLAIYLLDDLARCFAVDAISTLSTALNEVAARARPPNDRKELLFKFLEAAEEQVTAERYDLASLLLKSGSSLVGKMPDAELKKEVHNRELEVDEGQKLLAAAELARQKLTATPDDAEAHFALGQYLAIARHDWDAAVPHLSKGSDADARKAALVELQSAKDSNRAAEIGAAWLDAAEKAAVPAKVALLERARTWLMRGTAGLNKVALGKLQSRYKKVDADVRRLAGTAFVKRHSLPATSYGGHWYQFFHDELTWHQARDRCQELGGTLVCLEAQAEAQWVYQLAAAQLGKPGDVRFWIGATDEGHDYNYTWVNGSPWQFTDWATKRAPDPGSSPKVGSAVVVARTGSAPFGWGPLIPAKPGVPFICEWER